MLQVSQVRTHDEGLQSSLNIRNMMYEELQDHFDQAEAVKKDREEIRTKENMQQDFSTMAQLLQFSVPYDTYCLLARWTALTVHYAILLTLIY